MVIYEKIPGDTLLHEIQGAKTLDLVDLEEKIKLCALWLKKLHELKVEENFSEFKWQIMQDYLAKYYNEGKNLDEIIEVRELILAGKPQIFIHGDFQTSNAIINNGKIWFIDFNDSATGNSAIDVSGFLAQLRIELYRRGDLEIFDKLKQIFLENYSLVQESSQELRACLGLQYLKILSVLCWLEDPEEKTELFDEVYKYWKENAQI
jgi:thiamine kinase-like enzyme